MSNGSLIGWTDATWPIVAGCEYASPGCSNCWAVRDSWRLAHNPHPAVHNAYFGTVDKRADGKLVWSGIIRELWNRLDWPLAWKKPRRIFVCSQADLFHPQVSADFIAKAFETMARCPQHTFQVLTKHPARMRQLLNHDLPYEGPHWPLPNVWLGTTVEDQRRADERVPELMRTTAAKIWLSVEPMLEAIDLTVIPTGSPHVERDHYDLADIDWIVCGGESAQTRATTRPFDLAWARDLLAQCRRADVRFFMKQLGTKPIGHVSTERGVDLPMLSGKSCRYKWHEPEHWPTDLQVQEFPA